MALLSDFPSDIQRHHEIPPVLNRPWGMQVRLSLVITMENYSKVDHQWGYNDYSYGTVWLYNIIQPLISGTVPQAVLPLRFFLQIPAAPVLVRRLWRRRHATLGKTALRTARGQAEGSGSALGLQFSIDFLLLKPDG